MEHRAGPILANRTLSALIVVSFVLSAFAGLYVIASPPPSAAQAPIGDLIITGGTYTIENIEQPVDGDVDVSNGELIVRNGALMVISNVGLPRTVTIRSGGTLTLEHGVLTSYLDQIDPWPFLTLTVDGGTVVASDASMFSFPGSIIVMNGGELILHDSTIESLSDEDLGLYVDGSPFLTMDSADDGPEIMVTDGTLMMFDSSISELPEYPTDGQLASNLALNGDSTLLAVNSYIDVDFGPNIAIADGYTHNTMTIGDMSSAYLYGCSFEPYTGAYSSRAPAISASGVSTSPATPSLKGGADNTGQDISWLGSVDGLVYEVECLETMEIEEWDVGSLDDLDPVGSASLVVRYAVSSTYVGTRSIDWAPEGSPYSATDITPDSADGSVSAVYELPTTILTEVGDLRTMDLRFVNDGGAGTGSVEFDQICLMFTVGADAYIYRWLNVTIGDEYGVPIPDASIDAVFTGATELEGQQMVYHTPVGISATPPAEVLDYMGETAGTVFMTKSDGVTQIPFLTDIITNGGSSNSIYVGSYEITGSTVIGSVPYASMETYSFPAYPAMTTSDQCFDVTIDIMGISAESPDSARWLVVPPDLVIENMEYYHAGDVIVASDGNLVLRNAVFREVQAYDNQRTIYVDGTANFLVENSQIISALPVDIIVKGFGTLEIRDSSLTGVSIVAMGGATVILDGVTIDGAISTSWDSDAHMMIYDSALAQSPVLMGNTMCEVTNTSAPSIVVMDSAVAMLYRWIHITVFDGGDYPLEGANVYARFYVNETSWTSSTTDASGVARLKSLGTILTSTGSTYVGQYRVNASYWSDGVEHVSDTEVSVSVKPYTAPLTENATFAVLTMSSVMLPDLAVVSLDMWTEPLEVVLDTECTILVRVYNIGEVQTTNASVDFYVGATLETAEFIDSYSTDVVSAGSFEDAWVMWTPDAIGLRTLWAVVNDGPVFDERTFNNNNVSISVDVMNYADLGVGTLTFYTVGLADPETSIAGGENIVVRANLWNYGEASVTDVSVRLTVTYGATVYFDPQVIAGPIMQGSSVLLEFYYTLPMVVDNTEFDFQIAANPAHSIPETTYANNNRSATLLVLDIRADFKVGIGDVHIQYGIGNDTSPVYGRTVTITADVYNLGGTNPGNVSIEFGLVDFTDPIDIVNESIGKGMMRPISVEYLINITDGGVYTLYVLVDGEDLYSEKNETNNYVEYDFEIEQLAVTISVDVLSSEYEAEDLMVVVVGVLYEGTSESIPSLRGVWVELRDPNDDLVVASAQNYTTPDGDATFQLRIPAQIESDTYTVLGMVVGLSATGEDTVEIHGTVSGGGIPLLVWIVVICAIAAVVIGFTVYTYVYGLGKLVECGECGEFIPAASKRCPKCGVEFEVGTMKCSECGAWVPAESAECPNCGVKFVGEEIGEEDYLEKMRKEYDEMVSKYRELAKPELGKKFSEKKFEEWWIAQPTYISFDDWLAKEEEKRKESPIACPVCGTLNPKEAAVCNKCGTVFGAAKEGPPQQGAPPSQPGAGMEPAPEEVAPDAQPPVEPSQQPQAAPKMVIRRPIDRKVVPKKIIKTPISRNGSGSEGTENNEEQ